MQVVLTKTQIDQKIHRLAHQILENSYSESTLFLAGICGNGIKIAHFFKTILEANSSLNVRVFEISLNKEKPLEFPIEMNIDAKELEDGFIVLIDDVLNSGKTMQYALMKLLETRLKAVKTVALVDRRQHRFPIKCDYMGITLSTTLKNRVVIDFEEENYQAILV